MASSPIFKNHWVRVLGASQGWFEYFEKIVAVFRLKKRKEKKKERK
jgi:hypothetical protein